MKDYLITKLLETDTARQYRLEVRDEEPVILKHQTVSEISLGDPTASICLTIHQRYLPFPSHTHDYIELMYVCSGEITHVIGEKQIPLHTGDILLLGRATRHSIRPTGPDDIGINIIISTECFETILNQLRSSSQLPERAFEQILRHDSEEYYVFETSHFTPVENIMENLVYELLEGQKTDAYILRQTVQLLLAYLSSDPVLVSTASTGIHEIAIEKIRRRVRDYIQNCYRTASLNELAEILDFSPAYLSRWMGANMGKTFKSLLCDKRFEQACDLLSTTTISVEDIMVGIGYENSSYFHKEFKKRYGITPNGWRQRYRTSG